MSSGGCRHVKKLNFAWSPPGGWWNRNIGVSALDYGVSLFSHTLVRAEGWQHRAATNLLPDLTRGRVSARTKIYRRRIPWLVSRYDNGDVSGDGDSNISPLRQQIAYIAILFWLELSTRMNLKLARRTLAIRRLSRSSPECETRWRSHVPLTRAEHFAIRRAMTNYTSDVTINGGKMPRYEELDIAHASLAGRNFSGLSKWKTGMVEGVMAILHPAFRDSARFFSFFSISPSTWTAVQLWTEILIELESRAAMTFRKKKENWRWKRKTRKKCWNWTKLRWCIIIIRFISSPGESSPLFVERQCYIPRLLAGRRKGECVVRNKCW